MSIPKIMPNNPRPLQRSYSLLQSFRFAFRGIVHALHDERNLRIHFSAVAYVFYFSIRYYHLTPGEYALLAVVMGLVITCELLNTAVENAVDLGTSVYHPLAGIAKDTAAGAVLVSSVTAVAAAFFMLWDTAVFAVIVPDILARWPLWLLLGSVTLLWIFYPRKHTKREHLPR